MIKINVSPWYDRQSAKTFLLEIGAAMLLSTERGLQNVPMPAWGPDCVNAVNLENRLGDVYRPSIRRT
jgi:hypothetical protein